MKDVTYQGPEDESSTTTVYYIGRGEEQERLPKGVTVVVTNDVADKLAAVEGHKFDVKDSKAKKTTRASQSDEAEVAAQLESGPAPVEPVGTTGTGAAGT